jgi:hypothetical protein
MLIDSEVKEVREEAIGLLLQQILQICLACLKKSA